MTADREIVVSRVIRAPRLVVFEAYTSAEHLDRWWGPRGFTTTSQSFDFRAGGEWEFVMRRPDGVEYPNWVRWREIVPPERLVFVHGAAVDDPDAFESTITLVERGAATEVTMRALFKTKAQRDLVVEEYHAIEGAEQTLAGLADHVEGGDR